MSEYIRKIEVIGRLNAFEYTSMFPIEKMNIRRYKESIEEIPIADVAEVKHGKWLQDDYQEDDNVFECSLCKESFMLEVGTPIENEYHYCPNCGAKMDLKE